MRIISILLLLYSMEAFSQQPPPPVKIWAVDETEKIRRDDIHSALRLDSHNSVWKNSSVEICGARNEIVGFQLIIQTDSSEVRSVSVELESLSGPQFTIRNSSSDTDVFDYRQKHIEIFVARYIDVDKPTSYPSLWWPKAAPSSYYTGPIPDPLIPLQAVKRKSSAAISIPPLSTQSIWFDIFIPKDAKPGSYRGDIHVTSDGTLLGSVPVALRVFDFQLPDTTHFKNFFIAENKGIKYKHGVDFFSKEYYSLEMKYHQLAHRHRMNLAFIMPLDSLIAHDAGYFTHEYFSAAYKYAGPGENVGIDVYPIGVYDQPDNGAKSGFIPATKQGWTAAAAHWLEWFNRYSPKTLLLRYMIDEPDSTKYQTIRERSRWLKSVSINGKRIYSLVTTYRIDPRLYGSVDYWGLTAQSGYDQGDHIPIGYIRRKAADRKLKGEKIVIYNGTRPSTSCPHIIDVPASDSRVMPWIGWKYNIDLYFLWNTNLFYYDTRRIDPFVDNYTSYDGAKQWGNGSFYYPGESKDYPADDYGLKGPIASLRMKNWRRGQQDYEYLYLARSLNLGGLVDSLVNTIVPAAFDDVPNGQNSPPLWKERGYDYENVRRFLGMKIEAAMHRKLRFH